MAVFRCRKVLRKNHGNATVHYNSKKFIFMKPSPLEKVAFAKPHAEQTTDEESKGLTLFQTLIKIAVFSPHHRALFPVRGASPREKPKRAVTIDVVKSKVLIDMAYCEKITAGKREALAPPEKYT